MAKRQHGKPVAGSFDQTRRHPIFSWNTLDNRDKKEISPKDESWGGWSAVLGMGHPELKQFITTIREIESYTWDRLKTSRGCPSFQRIPEDAEGLNKKAKKHLRALNTQSVAARDGFGEIRMYGSFRLWGWREENIFRMLWIDPEHEVYPGNRK